MHLNRQRIIQYGLAFGLSLLLAFGFIESVDKALTTKSLGINQAEAKGAVGYPQEKDVWTLAKAIYGEARGEPYEGQVAIAAVIINRTKHESFPGSVHGVVFQPGAFTAVSDGQYFMQPNESAMKAARDALAGWDPTGGCIYYWNPVTATSKWVWSRPIVKRIGKHVFAK